MSDGNRPFDASELEPYTVIRVPEAFHEQDAPGPKRLVVIGHQAGHAVCIKATSRTEPYKNNSGMMESCVFYRDGDEPECFPKETVVQPDNQVPLPYARLDDWYREGTLEVLGTLRPDEFEESLLRAAEGERINERKKQRIVDMVRANRERRTGRQS